MQQQINFYRPEMGDRREIFASATILQAMATLVVAMLLTYAFAARQLTTFDRELDNANKQETAALGRMERLQPVIAAVSDGKTWAERLDDATHLLEEKQLVLSLVQGTTFGDTRGFARHLTSLARIDIDGIWLTHIRLSTVGGGTSLQGKAVQADLVPTYLQYLAEEPPFSAQRFQQFQIDGGEGQSDATVTFSVTSDAQFVARMVSSQ